jgi:hypothetical protein
MGGRQWRHEFTALTPGRAEYRMPGGQVVVTITVEEAAGGVPKSAKSAPVPTHKKYDKVAAQLGMVGQVACFPRSVRSIDAYVMLIACK